MTTLMEIEDAARRLPVEQQQELLLFIAQLMRTDGVELPSPRQYSTEQIQEWIEQDQKDMREILAGQ